MERTATYWWVELLKGLLFLALGVIALCFPDFIFTGLVVFFGVVIVAIGAVNIALYIRARSKGDKGSPASLIMGALSALTGLVIIVNPAIGQGFFNIIFPLWFISYCLIRIISFESIRKAKGKGFSLVVLCLNILGVFIGVITLFSPTLFVMSMGILISINFFILAADSFMEALGNFTHDDSGSHPYRQRNSYQQHEK